MITSVVWIRMIGCVFRRLTLSGANIKNPLISFAELIGLIGTDRAVVVDATYYAKSEDRDALVAFEEERIPGARFFDIDAVSNKDREIPHMLPVAAAFEAAMGALGIGDRQHVIVYDRHYLRAAPRVWWTFRRFGHSAVSILDGTFDAWKAAGLPVERGPVAYPKAQYRASPNDELYRSLDQVVANVATAHELYVDARSAGRFGGEEGDAWTSRRGHIKGSVNIPAGSLVDADGRLKSRETLAAIFAPVLDGRPVSALCGSGISAALVALGLHVIGHTDVAVYDGSWAEWGRDPATEPLTITSPG